MLDWFTTIPGILIICGVILLVIAIILFILGAKNSKKEVASTVDTNVSPVVNEPASSEVIQTAPIAEETVISSVDTVGNEVVNNNFATVEPVVITEPEGTNIPVEEPVVNNYVEEATSVINIPDMEADNQEVEPVGVQENSSVYGGETPVVDFSSQEEKPVTIYGGNDPLDATQTLPKMEENHVPYGGSYPEVRIVEPTVQDVVPTPVEETVIQMPTIEPVVESEPEVASVAVEEPVVVSEPTVQEQPTSVEEL